MSLWSSWKYEQFVPVPEKLPWISQEEKCLFSHQHIDISTWKWNVLIWSCIVQELNPFQESLNLLTFGPRPTNRLFVRAATGSLRHLCKVLTLSSSQRATRSTSACCCRVLCRPQLNHHHYGEFFGCLYRREGGIHVIYLSTSTKYMSTAVLITLGSLYSQGREISAFRVQFAWPIIDIYFRMTWITPRFLCVACLGPHWLERQPGVTSLNAHNTHIYVPLFN